MKRPSNLVPPDPWLHERWLEFYAPSEIAAHGFHDVNVGSRIYAGYTEECVSREDLARWCQNKLVAASPWPVLLVPYLFGTPPTDEWHVAYAVLKLTSP